MNPAPRSLMAIGDVFWRMPPSRFPRKQDCKISQSASGKFMIQPLMREYTHMEKAVI